MRGLGTRRCRRRRCRPWRRRLSLRRMLPVLTAWLACRRRDALDQSPSAASGAPRTPDQGERQAASRLLSSVQAYHHSSRWAPAVARPVALSRHHLRQRHHLCATLTAALGAAAVGGGAAAGGGLLRRRRAPARAGRQAGGGPAHQGGHAGGVGDLWARRAGPAPGLPLALLCLHQRQLAAQARAALAVLPVAAGLAARRTWPPLLGCLAAAGAWPV